MKISLTIPIEHVTLTNGYGQASYHIFSSLQRLGYSVALNDPTAQVEVAFCPPNMWQWSSKGSYKIGYVPWESTTVPKIWKFMMRTADEVWTTSPVVAGWFEAEGIPNVKVYPHGVDYNFWIPRQRHRNGPVKFLHIGEPAYRKAGPLIYDVFSQLDLDATLTFKATRTELRESHNIRVVSETFSDEQMVQLVHDHDVLVYPSYGEGFGLIPLQAMSTGMPVIINQGWAPYENLVAQSLIVNSRLLPSPWPKVHPGYMWHPDPDSLASSMQIAVENFKSLATEAYQMTPVVRSEYDWDSLTEKAFSVLNHI